MRKSLAPILFVLSLLVINCGGVGVTRNPGPTAYDQTVSVDEDSSIDITAIATHPWDSPLKWSVVIFATHGSLTGTLPNMTYTPGPDYDGADSFSFRVTDGQKDSNVATVNITVNPINDPPTSTTADITTFEDISIGVTPTVIDVDTGDAFTFSILTQPASGTVSILANQLFYEPNPGFNGTDSFNYRAFDSGSEQVDGTASVTVNAVNDPPVADTQTVTANEDVGLPITLTASDPDGDTLNWSIVFPPANGVLMGTAPNVTYLSDLDYNGPDSFTFRVDDGFEDSNVAIVNITVDPVNDAPTNTTATISTDEDTTSTGVTPTVLDVDIGDTFTFSIRTQPASGTASVVLNQLVYDPDPGFNGTDPFNYRATDSGGLFVDGTANVLVGAVNDAPVADTQSVTTDEDISLPITLTATDPDGDSLNWSIVFPPANGNLTGTAPNVTYVPDLDYNGPDSFTFQVDDGFEDSNVAIVNITVDPVNDAPTSTSALISTDEDTTSAGVTPTVLDVDIGDTFTFSLRTQPSSGTASIISNQLVYNPNPGYNGTDSFNYRATDSGSLFVDGTASVTIGAVNDPPVADTQSVTADEDVGLPITLTASDPDGDSLNWSIVSFPDNGNLTGTAPNVTYVSDLNYNGSDSFSFQVDDGFENSNVAIVNITIDPVNDAPTSTSALISTDEDTTSAGVTPAVLDVDTGESFTFSILTQPSSGAASVVLNQLVYDPNPGFNGTDSFNYRATDSGSLFVDGTAGVTVGAVNDPPVADTQSVTADEDVGLPITLTASDPDGDSLNWSLVRFPANGNISGTLPNLTYTSISNYNGTDSFAFQVNDGIALSNIATVDITVDPVNDAPTGTVAITGSFMEDATLIAGNSLADDDSLGTISYQWRSGGANTGTNSTTFVLTQAAVGTTISVVASYTDGGGTAESVASSPTPVIVNVNDAPTGTVTITGTPTEDETLTASNTLADEDSLGTISYQWRSGGANTGTNSTTFVLTQAAVGTTISVVANYTDGQGTPESVASNPTSLVANINDAPTGTVTITGTPTEDETLTASNTLADEDSLGTISYQWRSAGANTGAPSPTFVLTQAAVGTTISVVASYTDGQGTPESVASNPTSLVANINDAPTGTVTITGTPTEDETLTASNTLADEDSLGTISYQWRSAGADTGTNSTTFVLTQAAVGTTISVVASYTDGQGTPESVASSPTAAVANTNDPPTGTVTITGTPTEDETLTASNTLADEDSLGTISYQWRSAGANTGAASPTFVLTQAAVGTTISVVASYTDGQGTAESVASSPTPLVANVNDAPTGTVTITGTPTQGETLTASNTLADEDSLGTISYQWRSAGANTGANSPTTTFVLTQAAVGATISVVASYTDGGGTLESVASAPTAAVANTNDPPTGTVTITGTPTQGETLTASNTLADADSLGAISYQWRSAGANTGAASPTTTFVLTQAAVGTTISVVASYTDGGGTLESVASAPTAAVANTNDPPTGTVTITGTPTQGETLTASNTLADADSLGAISYQWRSAGANTGAASPTTTFVLTQAAVGTTISVVASYTDGGGTLESVASAPTAAVANTNDPPTGTVTITGTPTQGETLTASNTLADADSLGAISYQWRSAGANTGAASPTTTFVLTQAAVGTTISVVASYTDGGGTLESVASAPTAAVANTNDPPTGTVTITGTPTQGETLTASNTLADADSLGAISYQWRSAGANTGAASPTTTFVLTQAAVGTTISVVASYTDGGGTLESVASSPTALVTNTNDPPTGTVTITGTPTQGETLTASNTLADADSLGAISYQWRSAGANTGAASPTTTFVLTQAAVGTTISVVASYTDGGGTLESVASAPTAAVANVNDPPTGTVTITGTPTQGETLTASNTLADADSLGTISYQWRSAGANTGANSPTTTFVLTQAAVGTTISVVASYTDGGGTLESVASAPTAAVANVNDPPTGTVTITGTPTQGETLTASNTLADADSLGTISYQWRSAGADTGTNSTTFVLTQAAVGTTISVVASYTDGGGTLESVASSPTALVTNTNDPPTGTVTITGTPTEDETLTASNTLADEDSLGTISYQWRSAGADTGTNSTTFVLTQAAVGTTISVVASYTDGGGTLESVASAPTAVVANVNDAPTGTVTITGTPTEDETLTASNTLADEDSLGTISYQWRSAGADTGAPSPTFVLTQAAVGTTISVVASYTDGQGTGESVASSPTAAVANVNDAPTGTVTITGTPTEDETLTASNTLADEDSLGTISYQWRSAGADTGAPSPTFVLTQAAVGTTISVVASYTDGQGTGESVASNPTSLVANVNDAPTGTVTITGTPTEGELLTADTATLADEDGLGTLGYQWQANGGNIGGATAINYTLTSAEVGSTITVVVSYTDLQGTPESVASAAIGPVSAAAAAQAFNLTPGILFVDIDATGIADGQSWTDAYNHPQDALDIAQPGDEVWVADGVYVQRSAADSYVITMVEGVDLYGGFSGVETTLSERDLNIGLTTLDGEDNVDVVYGADNARLDGFAVTRAMSNGMKNNGVSPTVVNCIFEDNGFVGGSNGGAIHNVSNANAYISSITFVDNSGSAIFIDNSSPTINNSDFYNNFGDAGGAIQNRGQNSQPVITNSLFEGNTAAQLGGAIYNSEGEPVLINCTIVENSAGIDGGGIASEGGQGRGPIIINSILWNNTGLEIYNDPSSLTYVVYSNIEGGYSGTGNIDLDPYFIDTTVGDYRPGSGSPCIDAGDNSSVSTPFDLIGNPRIADGNGDASAIVDMGAYEYTP